MVDEAVRAAKIAAVTDAVHRIREVLPASAEDFRDDRTAREIITLNLRLAAAAGFRNLVAHQYGVIDIERLFAIASADLDDLLMFCRTLARETRRHSSEPSETPDT
jgi:uncharacterized protein with HEPN domain